MVPGRQRRGGFSFLFFSFFPPFEYYRLCWHAYIYSIFLRNWVVVVAEHLRLHMIQRIPVEKGNEMRDRCDEMMVPLGGY